MSRAAVALIEDLMARRRAADRAAQDRQRATLWQPDPENEPQCMAYDSIADVVGFGGAAGGGKSDLAIGKAVRKHRVSAIFRREATQLTGIVDRLTQILGSRDGYNGQDKIWRRPDLGLQIEFGSTPNAGDETAYQGRPKDLLVLDEATNFLESQARFLMGWVRTTDPTQRCQTLLTFNPPTDAEGRWVFSYFGPWLDPKHPLPAAPGELRWFGVVGGRDIEVPDEQPFVIIGEGDSARIEYDFNPADHAIEDIVHPESRTFIPSRIANNRYLRGTGYMRRLQAMPEPLRSQMLYGDFNAGVMDDEYQVIPTEWVEQAQARWKSRDIKPPMDSLGVDVARGGDDRTIIARRHGEWFDQPLVYPGSQTPDGPTVAGLVITALRDRAPIHIDVIGVGASPYDFLRQAGAQTLGVNVGEGSNAKDLSGLLGFANLRSELWWRMREALDPKNNRGLALPPAPQLLADLCAPTWKPVGGRIQVESRETIIKRIGRSPDWASAYILALLDTPKWAAARSLATGAQDGKSRGHDPYGNKLG